MPPAKSSRKKRSSTAQWGERIPVTPATHRAIKDVASGLQTTQDGAIQTLLQIFTGGGDPLLVARQYKEALEKGKKK